MVYCFDWKTVQSRRWAISWTLISILMGLSILKLAKESRISPDTKVILNVKRLSTLLNFGAIALVIIFNLTKTKDKSSDSNNISEKTGWKFYVDPEKQETVSCEEKN